MPVQLRQAAEKTRLTHSKSSATAPPRDEHTLNGWTTEHHQQLMMSSKCLRKPQTETVSSLVECILHNDHVEERRSGNVNNINKNDQQRPLAVVQCQADISLVKHEAMDEWSDD